MSNSDVGMVVTYFLSNKKFVKYLTTDEFENWLRRSDVLESWRENIESTEIKYSLKGVVYPTIKDYFTEFLKRCPSKKSLAEMSKFLALGFSIFAGKREHKFVEYIFNNIIPSLGFKFDKEMSIIEDDKPIKNEIPVDDEFESLISEFGEDFLKTRKKVWDFINSRDSKLMKNAIDEHRRLLDNIIRKIAPDDKVITSDCYDKEKHSVERVKPPFRSERIRYILSRKDFGEKEQEAIESLCKTVSNLYNISSSEVHLLKDIMKETKMIILMGERILHFLILRYKETMDQ